MWQRVICSIIHCLLFFSSLPRSQLSLFSFSLSLLSPPFPAAGATSSLSSHPVLQPLFPSISSHSSIRSSIPLFPRSLFQFPLIFPRLFAFRLPFAAEVRFRFSFCGMDCFTVLSGFKNCSFFPPFPLPIPGFSVL